MKIEKIECLGRPKDENLVNASLDVFIFLNNNYFTEDFFYILELTTPQFLKTLMEDCEFVKLSYPYLIVLKLTDEIIRKPIEAYV